MPQLRAPDGSIVNVDDAHAGQLIAGGYTPVSIAEASQAQASLPTPDSGVLGAPGALASGFLSGATLGLSDYALQGLLAPEDFERLAADRERHPIAGTGGQLLGAIAGGPTPSGALGRTTGAIGEGGGIASKVVAGGIEGAVQNAGAYLSDTALSDRELSAEGLRASLGTGFEFGAGGAGVALGIERGSIAARRLFSRLADGTDRAANEAEQAWLAKYQSTIDAHDAAADIARTKLAEAQVARQQAQVAQQHAAASVAEARAGRAPTAGAEPAAAAPEAVAGVAGQPTAAAGAASGVAPEDVAAFEAKGPREYTSKGGWKPFDPSAAAAAPHPDVEISSLLHDRAMAAAQPEQLAAWDAQYGQRLQSLMQARQVAGGIPPELAEIASKLPETAQQRVAALSEAAEAEIAAALREHDVARKEFIAAMEKVEGFQPQLDRMLESAGPGDLDASLERLDPSARMTQLQRLADRGDDAALRELGILRGAGGLDVQRPPVSVGEFGAPGKGGIKSQTEIARQAAEARLGDMAPMGGGASASGTPPPGAASDATAVDRRRPASEAAPVEQHVPAPKARPLSDSEFDAFKRDYGHAASEKQFAAEFYYSKGGDGVINGALREGRPLEGKAADHYRELMDAYALPESRLAKDSTLFRGLTSKDAEARFANVKPGDVIEDPAFTSTAYSETAKSRNEHIVFTIDAPAGTPGLPIRSKYSGEGEILLPPGARMRVDKVEYVPVSERWDPSSIGQHEVLPDKSVRFTDRGETWTRPPIKDIHVTIVNEHAPSSIVRPPRVGLDAPLDRLSLRQIGEHQDALREVLDRTPRDSAEYKALSNKWDAAVERRNAFDEGKLKKPEYEYGIAPPPAATDTLTGQLRGTAAKLGAGEDLVAMGAPARAEYLAAKEARTADAAEHFRSQALAAREAAAPVAGAPGHDLETLLRGSKYALDSGATMREMAEAEAAVRRQIGGAAEHPLSVKRLEQAHDAALEQAATATEPAERAAAAADAKVIEQQLTAVGKRPGAVEDVAVVAPAVTKYERASAKLTEALGDAAPPAAKEAAQAFRAAEDAADRKTVERTTRAIDDHVANSRSAGSAARPAPASGPSAADPKWFGPSQREQQVAAAKQAKLQADAGLARARAVEIEARVGADTAKQTAAEARATAEAVRPAPAAPPPPGKLGAILTAVGAAGELGVPGIPHPKDIPVIGPLLSLWTKFRIAKAMVGRFAGRIPATADARAAVLAARAKDKIAAAVDRTLGLVAEVAAKRQPIVAAATLLGRRLIDDGEPDAARGASAQQLAAVRIREISAAATRPELVTAMVRKQLSGITDPDLIHAAEQVLTQQFQYLAGVAPKMPPPNPFSKTEWVPSPGAADDLAQRVGVLHDPATAFQDPTPAKADALANLYAKLFAFAQQRLSERAADMTAPMPYRQQLQATLIFKVPVAAGLEPSRLVILQAAHAALRESMAPAPGGGGGGPPTSSVAQPTNLNQLYQTSADRRAARSN